MIDFFITFWKIICFIGFGSFILTVIIIIPFGAKDIFHLFRFLGRNRDEKK